MLSVNPLVNDPLSGRWLRWLSFFFFLKHPTRCYFQLSECRFPPEKHHSSSTHTHRLCNCSSTHAPLRGTCQDVPELKWLKTSPSHCSWRRRTWGQRLCSCWRGGVLLEQVRVAGGAHGLWENGGWQRQLVGHAALTEKPAAVLTLLLQKDNEWSRVRTLCVVFNHFFHRRMVVINHLFRALQWNKSFKKRATCYPTNTV